MNKLFSVGVDVSQETLDVAARSESGEQRTAHTMNVTHRTILAGPSSRLGLAPRFERRAQLHRCSCVQMSTDKRYIRAFSLHSDSKQEPFDNFSNSKQRCF